MPAQPGSLPVAGGGSLAYSLAANAAERGAFYAVSNRGFFRSPDAGQTWELQDLGSAGDAIAHGTSCLEVVDIV